MRIDKIRLVICFLLLFLTSAVQAQEAAETAEEPGEETAEASLFEQFPQWKFRDYFYQDLKKRYYRTPADVLMFDPLDLGYFPHETWSAAEWSLVGRWTDSWTYSQLLLLDKPAETMAIHGTDIGRDYGYDSDFYLYATLFVSDNYPEGTGSCYVYYSDSLLKGYGQSTGIFIDPENGISIVDNRYEAVYRLTNSLHEFTPLKKLDPADYPISEENIASSSFGTSDFIYENMDKNFEADWKSVKSAYHMDGSSVRAYRLEIIRKDLMTQIYINGVPVISFDDGMRRADKDGFVPEKVSWSYGPVLYEGGQTVTCSVGDLYIAVPSK